MDNSKTNEMVDFEDEYFKNIEKEKKKEVNLKDKLNNINNLIQSIPQNDPGIFKVEEMYQNSSDSINKNLETQRMLEECLENSSKLFSVQEYSKLIVSLIFRIQMHQKILIRIKLEIKINRFIASMTIQNIMKENYKLRKDILNSK